MLQSRVWAVRRVWLRRCAWGAGAVLQNRDHYSWHLLHELDAGRMSGAVTTAVRAASTLRTSSLDATTSTTSPATAVPAPVSVTRVGFW